MPYHKSFTRPFSAVAWSCFQELCRLDFIVDKVHIITERDTKQKRKQNLIPDKDFKTTDQKPYNYSIFKHLKYRLIKYA